MSEEINIQIINMTGKGTSLSVHKTDKIIDAKIKSGQGDKTQWKFNAQVLKNDRTIESYEIEDDDVIISNYRSKGGNSF
jgi:hypothetical protein